MSGPSLLQIPSDATLVAFLDGELDAADAARIQLLSETQPSVARRLVFLESGMLPFVEAFEPLLAAAPVSELQARLEALPVREKAHAADRVLSRRRFLGAAAACVGLGILFDRGMVGWRHANWVADGSWRDAVAQYMALYTVETLSGQTEQNDQLQHVGVQLGLALTPQSTALPGASLRRAQVLQYDADLIAQLVYLDDHYGPVALCLVRSSVAPSHPAHEVRRGLNVVYWGDGAHAYMLIGRNSATDLAAKAQAYISEA